MDCRDIRDSLGAFIDGELETGQSLAFEAHVEGCEGCHRELQEALGLGTLLREGLAAPAHAAAAQAAESGRFADIWARIEEEIHSTPARAPGLLDRLRAWWTAQARQPLWLPAAAAAATVAVVLGLVLTREDGLFEPVATSELVATAPVTELPPFAEPRLSEPAVAEFAPPPSPRIAPRRRPAEDMVAHNEAFIVEYEVDRGIVMIEQDPDEPGQPMIVWFLEEDEEDSGEASEG